MADVTTSTASPLELTNWDIPPGTQTGLIPRGEVLFTGGATIPALGAADESKWLLTCTFPRNFHYRVVDLVINAQSDSDADLGDPEAGMKCLITSNAPGFTPFSCPIMLMPFLTGDTNFQLLAQNNIAQAFASQTTNDRMAFYELGHPITPLIDAAAGTATLVVTWMNITDPTAAIDMVWAIRALQYDQDQVRKFPVHTPSPVLGP